MARTLLGTLALMSMAVLARPAAADAYKTTPAWLADGVPGVLYEPAAPGPKAAIAVFAMHPDGDYLKPGPTNTCMQLAMRGYRALCANAATSKAGFMSDMNQDKLTLNVKAGVQYLRKVPGVRTVVLFGHSGGGAMMAAYQNIAENGLKACQGPEKLIKCPDTLADLPPADGVMLIDASMGMPGSNLLSIDPAVADDDSGRAIVPELDMYNPANGFNPKGSTYSPEFTARFFAGQRDRMNRLIDKAEARLAVIEAGQGKFQDDEPFIASGAIPRENKLDEQDIRLLSQTKQAWPLLHAGGRVTTEVIHTVRVAKGPKSPTPLEGNALVTTVRGFLSTFSVRALPDYRIEPTGVSGVDFASSYGATYNSVGGISKPLLQMGLTGSYEFSFAEGARERATRATDKTLAYVEGSVHGFTPCQECALAKGLPADYYGDTVKTLYDYIDGWLSKPGRF
ncbi:MAG TPA: hypothetical protein VMU59_12800 [Caulobacteraceae bacterium]|nr:hypothetical protein [Caulobacteraceae bacterium]